MRSKSGLIVALAALGALLVGNAAASGYVPCENVTANGGIFQAQNVRASGVTCTMATRLLSSWLRNGADGLPRGKNGWKSTNLGGHKYQIILGLKASILFTFKRDNIPPQINVLSPASDSQFNQGQIVLAQFSCTDNLALNSCAGIVPSGAAVPTNLSGSQIFQVEAMDNAGNIRVVDIPYTVTGPLPVQPPQKTYPWHPGTTATVFSCGEMANASNAWISNAQSAYDLQWGKHCRHENQFYVAIPFADHLDDGSLNAEDIRIPWHNPKVGVRQSELKNHWVQLQRKVGGRMVTAFGQIEDVGPSQYTNSLQLSDPDYVFGPVGQDPQQPITLKPKNTFGEQAGIDLSPKLAQYLRVNGSGTVSWRFWNPPNANTIPKGPWSRVVTTRPPNAF